VRATLVDFLLTRSPALNNNHILQSAKPNAEQRNEAKWQKTRRETMQEKYMACQFKQTWM